MGAVPGGVNRRAASSFHEHFRTGDRFDQEPGSRAKPPEFFGGKNNIFATAIGGDPDAADATSDSTTLRKMGPLYHSFAKLMQPAHIGRLGVPPRGAPRQANRSSHKPFARCTGWWEFGSARELGEGGGNAAASLGAGSQCLAPIIENSFGHRCILASVRGNNRFRESNLYHVQIRGRPHLLWLKEAATVYSVLK
jgi:hypothetical protein